MDESINPIALLNEAISRIPDLENENQELRESISEVRALLSAEDRGWSLIQSVTSGERLEGLDLEEVHEIIRMIQPRVAAAGLTKRAADLHTGTVFGKGVQFEGVTSKPGTRGAKPGVVKFYDDPDNQESLFAASAHGELQRSRFIEGNIVAACNTRTKKVHRIPFSQIAAIKVDPDYPNRIIAYKRQWSTGTGTDSEKSIWYVTRRFEGTRPKAFGTGPDRVAVDPDVTAVDLRANLQPGFVLGIPDGLAGLHWAESYTLALRAGQTVTEGLARLIFKVTNKTRQGAQSAGVKVANMSGHGNTASMVEGQDVEAVRTAGQAYAFDKLVPIVGPAAAAWNVSVPDLLNSSASAGSSYGALQGLAPGNRNAMTLMQKEWASFFQSIFDVMGFDRPGVHWEPLETPDPYRSAQALTLLSIALSDEEYRSRALDILDIDGNATDIPDTLKMRSQPEQTAATQASPDQGRSNGTNSGGGGANDQRSDTVSSSEALRREMANDDFLSRFEELVVRAEAIQK